MSLPQECHHGTGQYRMSDEMSRRRKARYHLHSICSKDGSVNNSCMKSITSMKSYLKICVSSQNQYLDHTSPGYTVLSYARDRENTHAQVTITVFS